MCCTAGGASSVRGRGMRSLATGSSDGAKAGYPAGAPQKAEGCLGASQKLPAPVLRLIEVAAWINCSDSKLSFRHFLSTEFFNENPTYRAVFAPNW